MVAARGEDQQRFRHRVHRRMQDQLAQLLGKGRAAGFARANDFGAEAPQVRGDGLDVTRLAGAVDALERDEPAAHAWSYLRWNRFTARLCSARVSLNSLLPSPRETKYSALLKSGRTAASRASLPGIAIGVGGRPARV
jgi:hypothetical protein